MIFYCSFLDADFTWPSYWLGSQCSVKINQKSGVIQHVMSRFPLDWESNRVGTNGQTDRVTDLSELGSGLFLLHSAVSHEVVEHFAWKGNEEDKVEMECFINFIYD